MNYESVKDKIRSLSGTLTRKTGNETLKSVNLLGVGLSVFLEAIGSKTKSRLLLLKKAVFVT